jgi:hypothetical protein
MPFGFFQSLEVPGEPWESISLDFIISLLYFACGYDCIFSIIDKFSKRAQFLPCTTTSSAMELAKLVFQEIVCQHGLPKSIVSYKDAKFTGAF